MAIALSGDCLEKSKASFFLCFFLSIFLLPNLCFLRISDEILGPSNPVQPNRFGKVYSRRGKRGTQAEVEEKGGKLV